MVDPTSTFVCRFYDLLLASLPILTTAYDDEMKNNPDFFTREAFKKWLNGFVASQLEIELAWAFMMGVQ